MPRGWNDARRVLCVRLDTIGDVLMTTPAMRALRESVPGREITLLTSAAGAAIARLVPDVDETIVYDAPWLKGGEVRIESMAAASAASSRSAVDAAVADRAMIDLLRARGFDAAVIFTVYSQSALPAALLCHLAGVPLRAAHCREKPYGLLTTHVPETEPENGVRHEARRQLDLAAAVGCRTRDERLSLRVPAAAAAHVRARLHALGIRPGDVWIALHPGATAPSRRYPSLSYADAARRIVARTGCRVVVTGDASERALADTVVRGNHRAVSLAGELDLAQLCALIAAAPLLITNNTGPAHIAAACGTPIVDLYALTNPQHTPWMVVNRTLSFDVPCRNCYRSVCPLGHHDCLRRVTPEEVADAACDLLGETGRGWSPPVIDPPIASRQVEEATA